MLGTPLAQVPEDLQSVRRVGTFALRPEDANFADVGRPRLARTAVLEKKAPQVAGEDPNEKVCENITAIGSRLSKKRVCATRAEWADRKLQDRQAVEKAQTSPCMLQSTGGNGKPSC